MIIYIGQCFDDSSKDFEECSSKQCEAYIESDEDGEMMREQVCVDYDQIDPPGLGFTAKFNLNSEDIYRVYEFDCNYDRCNDDNIVNNVTETFDKEYNIELVLQRLRYKNENEGNETRTSTTKPSTSTTSLVTPTSTTTSVTPTSTTSSVTPTSTTSSVTPTSTTILTISSTLATTEPNNGLKIQSTNSMVYVTLITFMLHRIFLV
jgi:hypothetical protein